MDQKLVVKVANWGLKHPDAGQMDWESYLNEVAPNAADAKTIELVRASGEYLIKYAKRCLEQAAIYRDLAADK